MSDVLDRAKSPPEETFLSRLGDWFVRFKENRARVRSEGVPTPEAMEEALDYYREVRFGSGHDPVAFRRLLRRRGLPDWANPFPPFDPSRADAHEEGFLWTDVEVLVGDMIERASNPAREDVPDDEILRVHHAQICWMMILDATGGAWPRTLREIHVDNLVAITLEAMLNPHLEKWGLDPGKWKTPDLLGPGPSGDQGGLIATPD